MAKITSISISGDDRIVVGVILDNIVIFTKEPSPDESNFLTSDGAILQTADDLIFNVSEV